MMSCIKQQLCHFVNGSPDCKNLQQFFDISSQKLINQLRLVKNEQAECDRDFVSGCLKLIQAILSKLSSKQLSLEVLVLLNNLFCLEAEATEEILFQKEILRKLNEMVVVELEKMSVVDGKLLANDKILSNRQHFSFYSLVYFMTVLICQANKRPQDMNLRKHFFTNRLVKSLSSIEFPPGCKSQVFKLSSIVLVYLVKKVITGEQWNTIKVFILQQLSQVKEPKTLFNLTYCLMKLQQQSCISKADVLKYNLVDFLLRSIGNSIHGYHTSSCFDILKNISRGNPCVQAKLSQNAEFLQILASNFKENPLTVAALIEQIGKGCNEQVFLSFYQLIHDKNVQLQALKCCQFTMYQLSPSTLLRVLQNGFIEFIEKFIENNRNSSKSFEIALNLLDSILNRTKQALPVCYSLLIAKILSTNITKMCNQFGGNIKKRLEILNRKHTL